MSNEHSILIVDSNTAFATMLQEALEQGGEYHVAVSTNGDEALQTLAAAGFDMAIVDMGLTDPDGATLAHELRQQQPELRLMPILLRGEKLSSDLVDLGVQGVLTKPFFFPELPGIVGDALGRTVGESAGGPEPSATAEIPVSTEPTPAIERVEPVTVSADRLGDLRGRIPEKRMPKIVQAMTALAREIGAEAVILTCGGGLVAHAGRLSEEEADGLAQVVGENWRTSVRVAEILGQEQLRFEQSVEGGEHMFYSLTLADDIILSAALRTSVPLGMIRHRAKSTAETLRRLIGVG
jgi:CheY-like chemotaxis protein